MVEATMKEVTLTAVKEVGGAVMMVGPRGRQALVEAGLVALRATL